MAIRKGTGQIKRVHAKNYIQEQADARLREAVTPYQRQGLNALGVDSFEVKYYHAVKSTILCTCQQTEVAASFPRSDSNTAVMTKTDAPKYGDQEIVIDYSRPLFGQRGESLYAEDLDIEDELAIDDNAEEQGRTVINSLFSSSSDCGICFRTGYLPGYELYGYDRRLLTTYDIVDSRGYHKDVSTAPHTITQIDTKGWVSFNVDVPKYIKGLSFIIRNNLALLVDEVLYDAQGLPLSLASFIAAAGQTLTLYVQAPAFTHVVLEFDVGTEKVRANLAQSSRTTDWTLFDTLGNIQIILPMTIQEVSPTDVVHVPSRNTAFKVTDEQYLRTSLERNLDWAVSVRVLQPTEALRSIARLITLG